MHILKSENISLYESGSNGHTKVSNYFIDHFMTNANEAQIKIYLYLLRCVSSGKDVSLPVISNRFNYTEREIIRSLIYWDRQGLITLDFDENRNVKGICLNLVKKPVMEDPFLDMPDIHAVSDSFGLRADAPSLADNTVPEPAAVQKEEPAPQIQKSAARPFYPAGELQKFKENPQVRGLLFTSEQYLGRPLSSSDLSSILYLYDNLHFDEDLIEYLIEYCVNQGHRNMRYIESVALDWDERGVKNVEQAKYETGVNRKEYYEVLKAFGLSGRNPVKPEMDYIRRWKDEYGFSTEIIIEAVNRTMNTISKPSFQYADSILKRWKEAQISGMKDIEEADRMHESEKKDRPSSAGRKNPPSTKFQNFDERDYDFSELEKKLARN